MKPKYSADFLATPIVKMRANGSKLIILTEGGDVKELNYDLTVRGECAPKAADFFRFSNFYDISPDCDYLAYTQKGTNKCALYDLSIKKIAFENTLHDSELTCLRFSPDGSMLASGGTDGKTYIYDFRTKGISGTYGIRNDFITDIAFDPKMDKMAVGAFDNEIRIYKITDPDDVFTIVGFDEPIMSLRYIKDNELAVFYKDGGFLVFDTHRQKIIANPKKSNDTISGSHFTKEFVYIAAKDRNLKLLNAKTYEELADAYIKAPSIISSMCADSTGEIFVGCLDGTVAAYEENSDIRELEEYVMSGNFGEAYKLVEENPLLKKEDNYTLMEEAWKMSLVDIVRNIEDNKMQIAKQIAASFAQVGEKRAVIQTVLKQFEEFAKFKYAAEKNNFELVKFMANKNQYFKLTKLFEKIKGKIPN